MAVWRRLGLSVVLAGGCSDDGTVAAGGETDAAATVGPDADDSASTDAPAGTSGGSDPGGSASGGPDTTAPGSTGGGVDESGGSTTDSTGPGERPEVWQPGPGTSWQWQLVETIDTSIDVEAYDIDLFDVPQEVIDTLHSDGRIVICYFSAGSYEEWRDDADEFPAPAIGDPLDGWPGEAWLDHRDVQIRAIMEARLDLAVLKNCDAVEPDNVDGYTNGTGFELTADDQLDYNRFLAQQAHARGLSIGLKNDVDQVDALVDDFDWALNEECMSYDECGTKSPFIAQGKAVFHVEYVDSIGDGPALADQVCPQTTALGFSTLIKEWDLTPWRLACP